MIIFWSKFVAAEEYFPSCERAPTFEVLSFISPKDSDYGVFMADQFVVDLMQCRDVTAWQRRRFEVRYRNVESSAHKGNRMLTVVCSGLDSGYG